MKKTVCLVLFIILSCQTQGQCLSSANPVGGTSNLLTLKKSSFRVICFYRHWSSDRYFNGDKIVEFKQIKEVNYNYFGTILAYGLNDRWTLEAETGYFINKTMEYSMLNSSQKNFGFSNNILSLKCGIFENNLIRLFHSLSLGIKFPFSVKPRENAPNNPDMQTSTRALGGVVQSFLVKESPLRGYRFFLVNRAEYNRANPDKFKVGNLFISSFFISNHLAFPWLKGDWTAILQLRNEIRGKNYLDKKRVEASGSILFFLSPQLVFSLKKKIHLSVIGDFPIYQYFHETQLANKFAFNVNLSFDLGSQF